MKSISRTQVQARSGQNAGMKFDHIGMVVATLPVGRKSLCEIFSIAAWTSEFIDPINRVNVQFGRDASGICYELIAPIDENSPVARAVKYSRDILNHVAYLVNDLAESRAAMRRIGARPISPPKPAVAYGGREIQFFLTQARFLLELIEAPDHQHLYDESS